MDAVAAGGEDGEGVEAAMTALDELRQWAIDAWQRESADDVLDAIAAWIDARARAQTAQQIAEAFQNYGLEAWAESKCVKCGNVIGAHIAREIDGNEGRCGHERWHMGYKIARCVLPRGHGGEHAEQYILMPEQTMESERDEARALVRKLREVLLQTQGEIIGRVVEAIDSLPEWASK
jgi:hypothetical protein